mmetsp:Transcript_44231/g.134685  ORF Transcript_44231/g.134685 Transcript_44231/m.134685 type:complete len:256 (-) Transcript_44231:1386-2153(-)
MLFVLAVTQAGGQFAQRWALTSTSPAWRDGAKVDPVEAELTIGTNATAAKYRRRTPSRPGGRFSSKNSHRNGGVQSTSTATLSAVAANPRSYAYPDPRRYLPDGTLAVPPPDAVSSCPGYDQWEWGLQPGGPVLAPYKDRSVVAKGGIESTLDLFAGRDVAYLGGVDDVLPLKGSCEDDDFQGPNRLERGRRYYSALREHFSSPDGGEGMNVHRRQEVANVPHDHALMFQSPPGVEALMGAPRERSVGSTEVAYN